MRGLSLNSSSDLKFGWDLVQRDHVGNCSKRVRCRSKAVKKPAVFVFEEFVLPWMSGSLDPVR